MRVLFADLSGYTRLSREIDAEELHVLAGRFFDAVDAVVEGYGGTVRKHIGDCTMAVFGAPVAHSNDPERAARAALDIQRRVPSLADARGRPLGVHIGVASGQVVASSSGSARHREYTVTGELANLASRLTDAAQAGEVLISGRSPSSRRRTTSGSIARRRGPGGRRRGKPGSPRLPSKRESLPRCGARLATQGIFNGIVAAIMAIGRAMVAQTSRSPSTQCSSCEGRECDRTWDTSGKL